MNESKEKRAKGEGSIYLRGATWWFRYSHHGRCFRESSKSADEREALKQLRAKLKTLGTPKFVEPKIEKIRVEELAEDMLREYKINGRKSLDDLQRRWDLHLNPFFGLLRTGEVSSELIDRYVDARQRDGAKNATINRELAALKRMFTLGLQSTPPKAARVPKIRHLQENNVRKGFLEHGQYRKLVEHCPELWFRSLVEVGRTYGWRVSELLNMRVAQLDLAQLTIRLEPGTTKNREGREVIMTDAVYTLLTACVIGKTPDAFVFTRTNGKRVKDFRDTWAAACKHAGVPDLLFHDLRRTAARNMRRAGIAEGVIQNIGGWKTRSVFERYAIVTHSDIADAMHKLQQSEKENEAKIGHNLAEMGHSQEFSTLTPKSEAVN